MEKLKMIRGSRERAKEVKKTLRNWGAVNVWRFSYTSEDYYYFVINGKDECIYKTDPILNYLNYEVVELPEPEPKLQPFQKVLVRDSEGEFWRCSLFSHKLENKKYPFYCINTAWEYCIPYEGNEHLLGTTDSPKGGKQ